MKWFRKTLLWSALGCLGVTGGAWAQQGDWRQVAVPLDRPTQTTSNGVRLGVPAPLGSNPPGGIQQASYNVARGARPIDDPNPDGLFLAADDVVAVEAVPRPTPAVLEFAVRKPVSVPAAEPIARTPGTTVVVDERVIILDESALWGGSSPSRFYASAEWLMWTTRGYHLPPLVTTASALDPEVTRGALGFGSTRVLFGDGNTPSGLRPGARFTAGYNFDPCGLCAIEGSFFFLSRKNDGAFFNSNEDPVLGRPFFNINTGLQDRELTTSPGIMPGDVFNGVGNMQIDMSTTLFGAELSHRRLLCCGDGCLVTGLVGFRFLDLSDRLSITENIVSLRDIPGIPPNPPVSRAGDRILVFDRFDTTNRFYGGQVGASAQWMRGNWSLETQFKLGLGVTQQTVDIEGRQQINSVDGRVSHFTGGLYALPSNIGQHTQSRFAIVPEVGLKLGYQLTDNLRIYAGYDVLYWNSVLRPGDQIDQALDVNQVPNSGAPFPPATQRRPAVPFHTSSFWAHGFNAGLEFRY